MKSNIFRLGVLSLAFIFLVTALALAQEKTSVKVKSSEVVTGVVIVHVQKEGKSIDLQCNEGAADCTVLASGSYLMVQLPANYGMYDCKNVEVYRGDADKSSTAAKVAKVGAYCVAEK
ncbi:MAG: hypothetical protein ABSD75_21380 [Terriglobales bacterium]|jgi:hypothetical protein